MLETTVKRKRPAARAQRIPALSDDEIAALKEPLEEANGAPRKRGPEIIRITPPRIERTTINILGVTPYVQHAFSEKARKQMEARQQEGQAARGKKVREAKDFNELYELAKHVSQEGWCGVPAPAFRNAMIDACRLVGFKMTQAKLSIFIEADGFDRRDGTPLVRIYGNPDTKIEQPHVTENFVRNETKVADVRWRPMWDQGWRCAVKIMWDRDQFSATDIANLMLRAGLQVGIGEGRPNSPKSFGLDWGRFELGA